MFKYFLTFFSLFVVDRLTKLYILKKSSLLEGDFLQFYLNRDIAFSIPVLNFILWPLLILILVFLIFWWQKTYQKQEIVSWPLALIIIGAFSNILDRLIYGGVIDFINLPYWPIFNLSDSYITIGVFCLIIFELKKK
ncbi:signal peptidase II [Candidatus Nomurabacteria bacterium]|nr:signal peptidase II [Candidatus Nomurabacteria bacterium]